MLTQSRHKARSGHIFRRRGKLKSDLPSGLPGLTTPRPPGFDEHRQHWNTPEAPAAASTAASTPRPTRSADAQQRFRRFARNHRSLGQHLRRSQLRRVPRRGRPAQRPLGHPGLPDRDQQRVTGPGPGRQRGPELVDLRSGEHVHNASTTAEMFQERRYEAEHEAQLRPFSAHFSRLRSCTESDQQTGTPRRLPGRSLR